LRRMPEITDHLVNVDRAVRWGFSHELGPFELWDALGVRSTLTAMEAERLQVAQWVHDMLAAGNETFYQSDNGRLIYYDPVRQTYTSESPDDRRINLGALRAGGRIVRENKGASLLDLGDGVLCL